MPRSTFSRHRIAPLITDLKSARLRTLELISDLNSQQLVGPMLDTVNPLLWEIGHTAYFYELWILRELHGAQPFLANADELYNSISIAHNDRWDLPLPSLEKTKEYMHQVLQGVIQHLQSDQVTQQDIYLAKYGCFHEDMHTEAFTYTRRTLNYPAPTLSACAIDEKKFSAGALEGDAYIAAGDFLLGAHKDIEFCFDNEKWQHPVFIKAFAIARAATSYQQYADFVNDNGYSRQQFWDKSGWQWLQKNKITQPNGWKKNKQGEWLIKHFEQWQNMRPHAAVVHINWHEANAWCSWAGRRLPTEAEWERAASGELENSTSPPPLYPWGNSPPTEQLANLNSSAMGTIDVAACPESDSVYGCRQMIGNVWEWTSDTFKPYPGFAPDMYGDYSQPLFGQSKVLRGGAWCTRSRMIRNTWRSYYGAQRNDVFAGFRSCALAAPIV